MDDWLLKQKRGDVRESIRLNEFLHGVRASLKRRDADGFSVEITREPNDADYVALLWSCVVIIPAETKFPDSYVGGAVRYGIIRVPRAVAFQGGGMACESAAGQIARDFNASRKDAG